MVAGAWVLAACGGGSVTSVDNPPLSVTTERVEAAGGTVDKSFTGVVNEKAEVGVGFKTAGQIERINVKEGQYVRAGQVLAQLDSKDYRLGVEAVQLQYDQTKREVERLKQLYAGKAVTGNDLDKAVSGLEQLGVQLKTYKNKLAYTRLVSPVSGYVQKVNFERAEMVDAGTPVFTIINTSQLQVEVDIPLSVYQNRQHITSATCQAGGKSYALRMGNITPKADNNQLYKALFTFATSPGKDVSAGMNVSVNLRMAGQRPSGGLSVPVSAVVNEGGSTYVWVVGTDSTVTRQPVTVDQIGSDGRAVISAGLHGGETIVKAGVHALHDSVKVKVVAPVSATNVGGLL